MQRDNLLYRVAPLRGAWCVTLASYGSAGAFLDPDTWRVRHDQGSANVGSNYKAAVLLLERAARRAQRQNAFSLKMPESFYRDRP